MDSCNDSYINRSRKTVMGGGALHISGDYNEWGLPESDPVLTLGYCKFYGLSEIATESCGKRKKHVEGLYSISTRYGDTHSKGMEKCRKCKGPTGIKEVKLNEGPLKGVVKRVSRISESSPVSGIRLKSLADRIKEGREEG